MKSRTLLTVIAGMLTLALVGCDVTTEPDIQPTKPLDKVFTVMDDGGTVFGQIAFPSPVSIPNTPQVRMIDGEPTIVVSRDHLGLSADGPGQIMFEDRVGLGTQPPTVRGDYAFYGIQDFVSVVLTPGGPQGIFNHQGGGGFSPFSSRPSCMASHDLGDRKVIILFTPEGLGSQTLYQYGAFFYDDYRVLVIAAHGYPDPCSDGHMVYLATLWYHTSQPIDASRLELVF